MITDNLTAEERAKEFLDYINGHYDELKTALAKNSNYRADLIHDVFTEAILKVHTSILKNNTPIRSYKNFFFTAARLLYISRFEQSEKRKKKHVVLDPLKADALMQEDTEPDEERRCIMDEGLKEVYDIIAGEFGETHADLYFLYLHKSAKYNSVIKKIKRFVKEDPRIREIKDKTKERINGLYQS